MSDVERKSIRRRLLNIADLHPPILMPLHRSGLRPDKEQQATALIEAVADILWQAGELALASRRSQFFHVETPADHLSLSLSPPCRRF